MNSIPSGLENMLMWGTPFVEQVPLDDVFPHPTIGSGSDDPKNIPPCTLSEWCERISTPCEPVRPEDFIRITEASYMFLQIGEQISGFAKERERDVHITLFWMLSEEVGETNLVNILRTGSSLLQDRSSEVSSKQVLEKINGYIREVLIQRQRQSLEALRYTFQLNEYLNEM